MRGLLRALGFGCCAALLLPAAASGQAHFNTCDSVRTGLLRVNDFANSHGFYPWYGRAQRRAVNNWEFNGRAAVEVIWNGYRGDATPAEVDVIDYSYPDGLYSSYRCRPHLWGEIYVNNRYLGQHNEPKVNAVIAHEIGQALGLAKHTDPIYAGGVMFHDPTAEDPDTHDTADLRLRWGPWERDDPDAPGGKRVCTGPAVTDSPCPGTEWGETSQAPYNEGVWVEQDRVPMIRVPDVEPPVLSARAVERDRHGAGAETELIGLPATDFSDPRRLVGAADEVLHVRVLGGDGSVPGLAGDARPRTYVRAKVVRAVKGRASGTVRLADLRGVDAFGDRVHYRGSVALVPGREYVVAISRHANGDRLVLPVGGATPVTGQTARALVDRLLRAKARQIALATTPGLR